jgi:hypothetical protein
MDNFTISLRVLLLGAILPMLGGASIAAGSQNSRPLSASIVIVPSALDNFMIQTGNVRVTFSDGHSEVLTAEGNCAWPRVSLDGDVGWIRVDKSKVDLAAKNRKGEDKVIVHMADGGRKEFAPNPEAPFISNWSFADNGKAVAIQSSGYHGSAFYIKYDISKGKAIDEIDQYVPCKELPSWARAISDER